MPEVSPAARASRRDSQSEPQPIKLASSMLWRVPRPLRSRSKADRFILPCQLALADKPSAGPNAGKQP